MLSDSKKRRKYQFEKFFLLLNINVFDYQINIDSIDLVEKCSFFNFLTFSFLIGNSILLQLFSVLPLFKQNRSIQIQFETTTVSRDYPFLAKKFHRN